MHQHSQHIAPNNLSTKVASDASCSLNQQILRQRAITIFAASGIAIATIRNAGQAVCNARASPGDG